MTTPKPPAIIARLLELQADVALVPKRVETIKLAIETILVLAAQTSAKQEMIDHLQAVLANLKKDINAL